MRDSWINNGVSQLVDSRITSHESLLPNSPPRRDRPDCLHPAVAYADVVVVQVDGWVAVARYQFQLVPERVPASTVQLDNAVLVRRSDVFGGAAIRNTRHAGIDARRFQSGIDDRAPGGCAAHYGRPHEQTVLEARHSAFSPVVA